MFLLKAMLPEKMDVTRMRVPVRRSYMQISSREFKILVRSINVFWLHASPCILS